MKVLKFNLLKGSLMLLSLVLSITACSSCAPEDVVDPNSDEPNVEEPKPDDPVVENPFDEAFATENDEIKFDSKFANLTFDTNIYIDAQDGDDANDGLSKDSAIKSLDKLAQMGIKAGTQILLKGGDVAYSGMIEIKGIDNSESYIHVGSYGDCKARISIDGREAAVYVEGVSNVVISDLKIAGGDEERVANFDQRCGVYVVANGCQVENIAIDNVDIRNVYFYTSYANDVPSSRPCAEWDTANEKNYGWGIRARAYNDGAITGFKIDGCNINRVSHTGIKINGARNGETAVRGRINKLEVTNCNMESTGGPGSQYSQVYDGVMNGCSTRNSGSRADRRMWGRGSGMWLDHCDGFLFDNSLFENAQGIADCCGAHIDIYNKNITIQRCLSRNNAGGFVEVLGQSENCTYRYNISINDGWRNRSDVMQYPLWLVKDPKNPIMNSGCLVTINGLVPGVEQFEGPYNTYVYNNTIVCSQKTAEGYVNPLLFELATSANGVLVKNNIFWVEKQMSVSWSNHSHNGSNFINNAYDFRVTDELNNNGNAVVRDMTEAEIAALNFVVDNNLYRLYDESKPFAENALPAPADGSKNGYKDTNALGGDPVFANVEGTSAEDMIPSSSEVVNRGAEITNLAGDAVGVYGGNTLDKDIFGNAISTPIVGACSVN